MNASRTDRSPIEFAVTAHQKFILLFIIITKQILPATHVAEERHNVTVTYGPEIRTSIIISL